MRLTRHFFRRLIRVAIPRGLLATLKLSSPGRKAPSSLSFDTSIPTNTWFSTTSSNAQPILARSGFNLTLATVRALRFFVPGVTTKRYPTVLRTRSRDDLSHPESLKTFESRRYKGRALCRFIKRNLALSRICPEIDEMGQSRLGSTRQGRRD